MGKTSHDIPWSIVFVTAGAATVDHGFRPLTGYRALELGASAISIGTLAATFAVGAFLLAVPGGRLVDRIGPGRVMVLSSIFMPAALGISLFAQSLVHLLLAALLFGCAQILLVIAAQAAVVQGRSRVQLDVTFGWLSAGTSVGQIFGPMLALALPRLISGDGIKTGLIVVFCLALLIAVLGTVKGLQLSLRHTVEKKKSKPVSPARIIRIPGMCTAVVLSGVTLACLDLMVVFLPLWAEERKIVPEIVASLLATRGLMSLVSRISMRRLVEKLTRKLLIGWSLLIGSIGFGALPFVDLLIAFLAMATLGFCLGLVQPLTMTWVVASVPASSRGLALGMRMLANRFMQVLMPIGVGTLSSPLGFLGSVSTRSLTLAAASLFIGSIVSACAPWERNKPPGK